MNFLLKIVEGPNKGAEIALVEGVAVTIGKGDDCDIVLADPTMPDAPLSVDAAADGVSVNGERLEVLSVKTVGATSFAVGPADAPWGTLKWPKVGNGEPGTGNGERETGNGERGTGNREPGTGNGDKPEPSDRPEKPGKKRGGCCGCLVVLVLLLVLLAALAWFFRDKLEESGSIDKLKEVGRGWFSGGAGDSGQAGPSGLPTAPGTASISDVAAKYGLSLVKTNGLVQMSGNLKTRRERLAATAEAYQAAPGVELDLSDDESFRAAAEDALFTLTEGSLKVSVATNRVLTIVGASPSPAKLKKTLRALNADLAKLRNVDVKGVVIGGVAAVSGHETLDEGDDETPATAQASRPFARKKPVPSFPICGILTTPYPCLVMRDGRRLMEGAVIGGSVIVEIGADSVTLTNATGRLTWKP